MKNTFLIIYIVILGLSMKSVYSEAFIKPLSPASILDFSTNVKITEDDKILFEEQQLDKKNIIPNINLEEYHKKHLSIKCFLNMVDTFKILDVLA